MWQNVFFDLRRQTLDTNTNRMEKQIQIQIQIQIGWTLDKPGRVAECIRRHTSDLESAGLSESQSFGEISFRICVS